MKWQARNAAWAHNEAMHPSVHCSFIRHSVRLCVVQGLYLHGLRHSIHLACLPFPLSIISHPLGYLQKKDVKALDKPTIIKTHLRDMPILPEMVGSLLGVYSGKVWNIVEVRPEMIGHYLAEFSVSYKPTLHGRPGLGATHSSRFIPLK